MELVLVVLAMVVTIVAIDAIGRFDERRPKPPPETPITTGKIVVDMDSRDRD
jgi:hypothetical protein